MEIIKLLLAMATVLAYILNINDKKLLSYALWILTNACWFCYMAFIKEHELAGVYFVYLVICAYGIRRELKLKT